MDNDYLYESDEDNELSYNYVSRQATLDEWISENENALLNVWDSIQEQQNIGILLFDKITFHSFCELTYNHSNQIILLMTEIKK